MIRPKRKTETMLTSLLTFVMTVSLMYGSALRVSANDLEQVELNITCRDSKIYPELVGSTQFGDGVTLGEYYSYESSVTYTLYELIAGYTYSGYFEFQAPIVINFDKRIGNESYAIHTNLKSVEFSEPGGINYVCDFDNAYDIYLPVDGDPPYYRTILPNIMVRIKDLYSEVISTNLRVTLNFTHNISVSTDSVSNSDFIFYLTCDNAYVTTNNVLRELGDHRSAQLDTIIDQNNNMIGQNNTISKEISNVKEAVITFREAVGNWFSGLYSRIENNFISLFQRMDENQEEQLKQESKFHDEEMEQSSEQHDEALHGFDASDGNDASGNLENSLGSMEEIESGITDKAFEGMDEYTIPEEGVTGYAQQFLTTFPLVAAMMQSIYDSSGPFNILLSVTFTFVLVSILIGLYRFYKD